jgi:hypothetical protein
MNRVLKTITVLAPYAALSVATLTARAQIIIPAAKGLGEPNDFSFYGRWTCSDKGRSAFLFVGQGDRRSLRSLKLWADLQEREDGFRGNYFVGYDRDRRHFLLIDTDDPAVIAYSTDGWHGETITLTSIYPAGQFIPSKSPGL